ncbi:hypothetical protein OO184_24005 [Photorhabdus sp. APURE]|uniref:hypothetical protein n=1 Tax=Photorhabdus aballayi TaxID=2991723 RepID=UPI00223E3AFB|nr:hypothetical protein [Photorhabdus aballayi]MCW7550906.1 hypothetical protein [Photorhabdus aballayi]
MKAEVFDKELAECKAKGGDCGAVIQKYLDTSNKNSAELEEKSMVTPIFATLILMNFWLA